jgi:hypothetical protein
MERAGLKGPLSCGQTRVEFFHLFLPDIILRGQIKKNPIVFVEPMTPFPNNDSVAYPAWRYGDNSTLGVGLKSSYLITPLKQRNGIS